MIVSDLSIIGLGLIGGSIALDARTHGLAGHITAWDRDADTLRSAAESLAIDRAAGSLEEACAGAELIILAVPVAAAVPLAMEIHRRSSSGTVITDVGSTKESITAAMDDLPAGRADFVGGHPIAGIENSGFGAARKGLFSGAPFIITATEKTSRAAASLVEKFWTGLGCSIHHMPADEHDRIFALVSHLPHLVAYALVNSVLSGIGDPGTVGRFAGGGFRDFVRIAASDPVMWRDISLDNSSRILDALNIMEKEISAIKKALQSGDGEALHDIYKRARELKKST